MEVNQGMFYNPQFGGVPQGINGTGMQFNGFNPQQIPQMKNHLTQEEIQKLIQKENQFSLAITETEKLRAACSHRWNQPQQNGMLDAITESPDGTCKCAICGYEFSPIDINTTPDLLDNTVRDMLDILQTIKMLYVDMPDDVAKQFFTVIPLLERVPKLFERAAKSWMKYDNTGNGYGFNNKNMNIVNLFNMMSGYLSGGMQPNAYQQAPQMQFQQPMMNPGMMPNMMGQPMMGSNGFVQQPGYMPNTMGYAYNPMMGQVPQQQPVAAPQAATGTAPAEATATTDGKNVTVNASFKA